MAITREQKNDIIETGKQDVKDSDILLFVDFKGTSVEEISSLRKSLREVDARMKVIKKRLLKIILGESGIKLDPTQFEGQIAAIFAHGDISDVAGPVYKFSKSHDSFEIVGGVDVASKKDIEKDTILTIGALPSRDVLLGHIIGSIVAPLRGLMFVLSEKSKK